MGGVQAYLKPGRAMVLASLHDVKNRIYTPYIIVHDRIIGDFPAKNTVYIYIYIYMVMANPNHLPSR
jgi:hypothetical protein